MEIVWLIVAVTLALTATIGALRAAARGWRGLALELGLLLTSAGACYLIAGTKTAGYLPGLGSMMLCALMVIAAGGVALGALARWLWDHWRPVPTRAAPVAHWDLWLIGAVSALAVLLSGLE